MATIVIAIIIDVFGFGPFVQKVLTNPNYTPYSSNQSTIQLYYYLTKSINTSRNHTTCSDQIVIVDVGQLSRKQTADVINKISIGNAVIVGLDVRFGDTIETYSDSLLVESIINCKNIVLPYGIDELHGNKKVGSFFDEIIKNKKMGFTNLYDSYNRFCSFIVIDDTTCVSFPYIIATEYATKKSLTIRHQLNDLPFINFSKRDFSIIDGIDYLSKNDSDFDNKIALLGCVYDSRDSHKTYAGELPGVLINAFAIDTILNNRFVKEVSKTICWLIAFFIIFVFSSFSLLFRPQKKIHLILSKIVELIMMFVVVFAGAILFYGKDIYIDIMPYFISIFVYLGISLIYSRIIKNRK